MGCELGECWTHQGAEKSAGKGKGAGKAKGGGKEAMFAAFYAAMKGSKGAEKGSFGPVRTIGKGGECKWCAAGECWTHQGIAKPAGAGGGKVAYKKILEHVAESTSEEVEAFLSEHEVQE